MDPFAPITGEGARDGFAADVVAATAAAGELAFDQEATIVGEVLATSAGTVDLAEDRATATVESAGVRIEQRYADGEMTEQRLDRPGADPAPVGGWPLLLPDSDAIDDAPDLARAVQAALELTELRRETVPDAPGGTTCFAGTDGDLRVDVCTDDDLVLRLLSTTVRNPEGFLGTTRVELRDR